MNLLQWYDQLAGDSEDLHQLDTADRWFSAWLVACETILIQISREEWPALRMFKDVTSFGMDSAWSSMENRISAAAELHYLIEEAPAACGRKRVKYVWTIKS